MCWRVPAGVPPHGFPAGVRPRPPGTVPQDDQPAAKRARQPAVLVTRDVSANESEGLEVLLGLYEPNGVQQNHGQAVFKKKANGAEEQAVFLYYWGTCEADRGWWLGHEVNGCEAYCWVPSPGFPPPARGWRIPTEESPHVEDLKVVCPAPGYAGATSSTADISKAAVHAPAQPMVVPPKQAQSTAAIRPIQPVAGQQAQVEPVDVASCRRLAGRRLNGEIKIWNADKSIGFISSPSFFRGDLVVRRLSVQGLQGSPYAGRKVNFQLRFDTLGSPEAHEVQEPAPESSGARKSLALSAAGMPAEDAQWLDLFYKCLVRERAYGQPPRKLFWGIVNATKNQELDLELRSAAQHMLDKWADGKAS